MYLLFDLPQIVFLGVLINFILLLVFLLFCSKEIRAFLRGVSRETWVLLLLIFIFAFALRMAFPPVHLYYSDGLWNMEVANNMVTKGSAEMCQYENFLEDCYQYRKPAAVPLIYAVGFLFFGAGAHAIFYSNLLIGSLLVLLVFCVAYAFFKNEAIALFSSFIFSLIPLAIVSSNILDNDIPSLFFILLSIFCFFVFFEGGSKRVQFLAVVSLVFALQTKSMALLLLLLLPPMAYFYRGWKKIDWRAVLFLGIMAILVGMQYANYLDLNLKIQEAGIGRLGDSGLSLFLGNLGLFSVFLFRNAPFFVILIFFIGVLSFAKCRKKGAALAIYFTFLALVLPLLFFQFQERHLLLFFVGFSFLCGSGFYSLGKLFKNELKGHYKYFVILFTLILLISFCPLLLREFQRGGTWSSQNFTLIQTPLLKEISADFPKDCFVIAPDPSLFSFIGLKSIQLNYFEGDQSLIGQALDESKCLIYYKELAVPTGFDFGGGIVLREELSYKYKGKNFVFYRVSKKA